MKQLFNALKSNIQSAQMQSRTSIREAVSGFTNPLSSSFEDNEVYFLSFGVPAKPRIAKNLIEANDNSKKAIADFIDSFLVKICLSQPHKMLQANKVLRFAKSRRNCAIYKK